MSALLERIARRDPAQAEWVWCERCGARAIPPVMVGVEPLVAVGDGLLVGLGEPVGSVFCSDCAKEAQ